MILQCDFCVRLQAGKPVPEAVKQGVETPSKGGGAGKSAGGKSKKASSAIAASKAEGNPQFEGFIRRLRGGK